MWQRATRGGGALLVAATFGAAATVAVLRPVLPDASPAVPLAAPSLSAQGPSSDGLVAAPLPAEPEPATLDDPLPAGQVSQVVATAASERPPDQAVEAYLRATSALEQADPTCHLDWTLLAAVGAVESDHGRVGESRVDDDGVARPAIIGPRLDGRRGFARVVDTDAGQVDGDPRFDHAVGPLQFIPATWAVVAVDADGDGVRNPQDIDDASLAAAVLLCGGDEDLRRAEDRRAALYRYNHSAEYVERVLETMDAYAAQSVTPALSTTSVITTRTVAVPVEPPASPQPEADPEWTDDPHQDGAHGPHWAEHGREPHGAGKPYLGPPETAGPRKFLAP